MFDPNNAICALNETADLWYLDSDGNAYFFPQGWGSHLEDIDEERVELYGYAPVAYGPNSAVDTLYVGCDFIAEELTEITETIARDRHPALATYLDAVNAGR